MAFWQFRANVTITTKNLIQNLIQLPYSRKLTHDDFNAKEINAKKINANEDQ